MNKKTNVLNVLPSDEGKQKIDWGLDAIHAQDAWKIAKGKGVKVAVLDTGVNLDHPDLRQNIRATANFSTSKSVEDEMGHGTHVAGIIAAVDNDIGVIGVAPEAELYIAKVLNDNGGGSMKNIVKGIRWAIAQGVDVINMSLGTSQEPSDDLHEAVIEAKRNNIIIVAASGNEGSTVGWPGRYPETICVAAVDDHKQKASFSNSGIENVISAPGVDILSTYKKGTYATLSGTSMATPIISGAVSLYISWYKERYYKNPSVSEVYLALLKSTDDLGIVGKDEDYGEGIINLTKLFKQ